MEKNFHMILNEFSFFSSSFLYSVTQASFCFVKFLLVMKNNT